MEQEKAFKITTWEHFIEIKSKLDLQTKNTPFQEKLILLSTETHLMLMDFKDKEKKFYGHLGKNKTKQNKLNSPNQKEIHSDS